MTDFGGLVTDINKGTGNGGTQQTHDDDWFRNTFLPTIGRYVESRVKPLRQRIDELERKTKNWEYRGVFEIRQCLLRGNFCNASWIALDLPVATRPYTRHRCELGIVQQARKGCTMTVTTTNEETSTKWFSQ